MDKRSRNIISAIAVIALFALLTGCTCSSQTSTTPTTPTTTNTAKVLVYFIDNATEKLMPVQRTVATPAVSKGAMTELLLGPNADEKAAGLSSTIPEGTVLRDVSIKNKVVTVDLTSTYGSGGGSLSMMMRIAQVVYTLTQFPTVDSVKFELDGKHVTALGGEGIIIDKPQTRANWEDSAPAILLESPVFNTTLKSPQHFTGTANVYEAVFFIDLVDSAGTTLVSQRVKASAGTGTRGTFDKAITWTNAASGSGKVILWYPSPKDGSHITVATIPVKF